MGFANAPTSVLVAIRLNLLHGLDLVAEHLEAGTFHIIATGKASPPSQAGQLTLALLNGVDAELANRKADSGV